MFQLPLFRPLILLVRQLLGHLHVNYLLRFLFGNIVQPEVISENRKTKQKLEVVAAAKWYFLITVFIFGMVCLGCIKCSTFYCTSLNDHTLLSGFGYPGRYQRNPGFWG